MRTIDEIRQEYAQTCAKLGDLVIQQRRLHAAAEHCIRLSEQLDQEARSLSETSEQATKTPEQANNDTVTGTQEP
jgi:hypothetical protein